MELKFSLFSYLSSAIYDLAQHHWEHSDDARVFGAVINSKMMPCSCARATRRSSTCPSCCARGSCKYWLFFNHRGRILHFSSKLVHPFEAAVTGKGRHGSSSIFPLAQPQISVGDRRLRGAAGQFWLEFISFLILFYWFCLLYFSPLKWTVSWYIPTLQSRT